MWSSKSSSADQIQDLQRTITRNMNDYEARVSEMRDKHELELQQERNRAAEAARLMEIERQNLHAHIATLTQDKATLEEHKAQATVLRQYMDTHITALTQDIQRHKAETAALTQEKAEELAQSQKETEQALALVSLNKDMSDAVRTNQAANHAASLARLRQDLKHMSEQYRGELRLRRHDS